MPVTYRFDSRIVTVEMAGEYTTEEIRQTILQAFADSRCPVNSCLLINLSESRSIFKRSLQEVQSMAQFLGSLAERYHHRVAFVASQDLPFGLARMSTTGIDEKGIISEVFRTLPEAWEWLLS